MPLHRITYFAEPGVGIAQPPVLPVDRRRRAKLQRVEVPELVEALLQKLEGGSFPGTCGQSYSASPVPVDLVGCSRRSRHKRRSEHIRLQSFASESCILRMMLLLGTGKREVCESRVASTTCIDRFELVAFTFWASKVVDLPHRR